MDDVGWLELFENSLGVLHAPQIAVLAAQKDVFLLLLGLDLGNETASIWFFRANLAF